MRYRKLLRSLAPILVLLGTLPALAQATIEGRWQLIEQSYGEGRANLVAAEEQPLWLEFVRRGVALEGRVQTDPTGKRFLWPRLSTSSSQVGIDERTVSADEREIRVKYRVMPSADDDVVLIVTEQYRLADQGRSLIGTVEVVFRQTGKKDGSYRLHRRYERLP